MDIVYIPNTKFKVWQVKEILIAQDIVSLCFTLQKSYE